MEDNKTAADFWWSVELEAEADNPAAEEWLADIVDMSGSVGAEFADKAGKKTLRAFYVSSRDITHWISVLEELLPNFPGLRICSESKVENKQWQENFLDAFPPLAVGVNLAVMAPWHKDNDNLGKIPFYIYPSSAFGTGYHESTQIAISMIERFVKIGDTIIDIGTGSGILFIVALKLGAARAIARDIDPTVVAEALRNMTLNDIPLNKCDLRVGALLGGIEVKADILAANILIEPNLLLLKSAREALKPSGVAIFSGMTENERPRFLDALSEAGAEIISELTSKNWWGCAARFV
ncbi:ribosomal protein L11 methyltransferase [Synergistales bacterium]|nr:ribosomal protein L11 methyltransferase [Synergistales bacterium]